MENYTFQPEDLECLKTVQELDEAVVAVYDGCKSQKDGPLSTQFFPIDQKLHQLNTYMGNHNQATPEACEEAAKIVSFFLYDCHLDI